MKNFFDREGWRVIHTETIPSREAVYCGLDGLTLSNASQAFLRQAAPEGLYRHQWRAIEADLGGKNICLTTGTASGKSLVFYVAAIERLVRDPKARILALYPLRALGQEQEQRWRTALRAAGLDAEVGRLDGQVPVPKRAEILRTREVLVATPDIVHAWLFLNLSDQGVRNFLRNCSLIIVDEAHTYTGVFGSNSAYLFRRLRHAMALLGSLPRFVAASATISRPQAHLENLIGVRFDVVGEESDSSPRRRLTIRLVDPPSSGDLLTHISRLMGFAARRTSHRFLAFVDSRKQTEHIATILSRAQDEDGEEPAFAGESGGSFDRDHLRHLSILPYRAGYEETDRTIIQERLSRAELTGVISTSALELGIDIPHLTLGVLVGVPSSATSFYQRIGRIGRHTDGEVIVINTGDFYSTSIFNEPHRLLNLPLSEGALYLDNRRIQGIHALCLARSGGEHDQAAGSADHEGGFKSPIAWPATFIEMCDGLRVGNVPADLQNLMIQCGDDPNHTFPLRDVDLQFRIERVSGPVRENLGSLSYDQLMREAYPGAIYYYTTQPYRVCRVRVRERRVEVRREKHYITQPEKPPVTVYPNLMGDNVFQAHQYGRLMALECYLQIRECINGFREKRGPNEIQVLYPLDRAHGVFFDQPRFVRNFFTTGVVLSHPALNAPNVQGEAIAELLFEVFLMVIPFERRDIYFASGRHRMKLGPIAEGDRFVCIYDQTYGSLRLSGRVLDRPVLRDVVKRAAELTNNAPGGPLSFETRAALEALACALDAEPVPLRVAEGGLDLPDPARYRRVMLPGSRGLNIRRDNMEYEVEAVFYSSKGLSYRGRHVLEIGRPYEGMTTIVPVEAIEPVPGECRFGLYDCLTGDIVEENWAAAGVLPEDPPGPESKQYSINGVQ